MSAAEARIAQIDSSTHEARRRGKDKLQRLRLQVAAAHEDARRALSAAEESRTLLKDLQRRFKEEDAKFQRLQSSHAEARRHWEQQRQQQRMEVEEMAQKKQVSTSTESELEWCLTGLHFVVAAAGG